MNAAAGPDGHDELTATIRRIMPFCEVLGLTVVEASAEKVVATCLLYTSRAHET